MTGPIAAGSRPGLALSYLERRARDRHRKSCHQEGRLGLRAAIAAVLAALVPACPSAAAPSGVNPADAALIRRFFALVDRHRPAEAVALMSPAMTASAGTRAAWTRQFAAIGAASVRAIAPSSLAAEAPCRSYKVAIDIRLARPIAGSPIPAFGWSPNLNVRWITICPRGPSLVISSFATGP